MEWKVVGSEIARLREIKDEDELALIRQACRITGEAFGESQNRVPTADGVRELQNRRVEVTYGPGSGR